MKNNTAVKTPAKGLAGLDLVSLAGKYHKDGRIMFKAFIEDVTSRLGLPAGSRLDGEMFQKCKEAEKEAIKLAFSGFHLDSTLRPGTYREVKRARFTFGKSMEVTDAFQMRRSQSDHNRTAKQQKADADAECQKIRERYNAAIEIPPYGDQADRATQAATLAVQRAKAISLAKFSGRKRFSIERLPSWALKAIEAAKAAQASQPVKSVQAAVKTNAAQGKPVKKHKITTRKTSVVVARAKSVKSLLPVKPTPAPAPVKPLPLPSALTVATANVQANA